MHAWFYNSDFVLNGGFYHEIIEDVSQNRNEVRLSAVNYLQVTPHANYGPGFIFGYSYSTLSRSDQNKG
jgi:hypothetical protein